MFEVWHVQGIPVGIIADQSGMELDAAMRQIQNPDLVEFELESVAAIGSIRLKATRGEDGLLRGDLRWSAEHNPPVHYTAAGWSICSLMVAMIPRLDPFCSCFPYLARFIDATCSRIGQPLSGELSLALLEAVRVHERLVRQAAHLQAVAAP